MKEFYSLEESYEILNNLTKLFVPFLGNLMEIVKLNRINLVSTGNEISAGFINLETPIVPWLDKLQPFIKANNINNLNIRISSFPLLKNNNNFQIYHFLKHNPSRANIKNRMIEFLMKQPDGYDLSIIDSFSDNTTRFLKMYSDNVFTITNLIGCTGEILQHFDKAIFKSQRMKMLEKEFYYLNKILYFLISNSEHSYITVSNVPTPKHFLPLVSSTVKTINDKLKIISNVEPYTMYFEGFNCDFKEDVELKKHGQISLNLLEQYKALCNYVEFLMQQLPIMLMKEELNRDPLVLKRKYKGLDYDGNLEQRIKQNF